MQTENTAQASSDSDPATDSTPHWWTDDLDERQRAEVKFAHTYVGSFHHGTDGHHWLMLISALATALDNAWGKVQGVKRDAAQLSEEIGRLRFIAERDQDTKRGLTRSIANLRHTIWELDPTHRDACAHTWLFHDGTFEKDDRTTPIDEFAAVQRLESVLNAIDTKGRWHDKLAGYRTLSDAMGKAAPSLMAYKHCTNGEAYAMMHAGMAVSERMQGIKPDHSY